MGVKLRAVAVRAQKRAEIVEIEDDLKAFQQFVGGLIDVVYPWKDAAGIICNDEGLINGMPLNRALFSGQKIDRVIAGDFLVVGLDGDDFTSLDDNQVARYTRLFAKPHFFMKSGDVILVFKER